MTEPTWTLRLQRAKVHFDVLNEALDGFVESGAYTIDAERDHNDRLTLRASNVKEVPIEVGPIVGDCLHKLRSALDHLAFALAVAHSGSPLPDRIERASAFPIFDRSDDFSERDKRGNPTRSSGLWKIQGMSDDVQREIEALQPFAQVVPPDKFHYLSLLRDLSDADKHREPQLAVPVLARGSLEIGGEGLRVDDVAINYGPLEDGRVLATAELSGSKNPAQINGQFMIGVSFAEGFPGRGMDVRLTIERIAQVIQHQIVPALTPYV